MSDGTSYHGQPILKRPVWTWEIPVYFFTGGLAGASAGLAWLTGLRGNAVLSRRAWVVALTGVGVSPPLLISDLGRPERFLNMLRMFKVTSPMSVGSWVLATSGPSVAVAALSAHTGRLPRLGALAGPTAALSGLPLATYTGALLANTAVPVWHEARRELPFVFGAGAALSAGAACAAVTPTADGAPARRLALGAAAARFSRISTACILGGATLMAARGSRERAATVAAGLLLLGGAFAERWSVYRAGQQSSADPRYVVAPQRRRIEQRQAARPQLAAARRALSGGDG